MNREQQIKTSKFLSLILRHKPETIGLLLDEHGWANTQELLEKSKRNNAELTLEVLKFIVNNNDKKRFVFSDDFSQIRASQGHSIDVDLELKETIPPDILFHGTAERNLESIRQKGLLKGQRHHVHLSVDIETAHKVGIRYGKPVVLKVEAKDMYNRGFKFFISANGVWLTDSVSPEFIDFEG